MSFGCIFINMYEIDFYSRIEKLNAYLISKGLELLAKYCPINNKNKASMILRTLLPNDINVKEF